ncbi:hypothetical protein MNB_SUP05-5-44 [hydrothermal vent metagenome]|uniref:DUF4395 domain-containing protein n=1 Tax=hydrothermal vent metagenome TaxID=652676 RepID=A0A1W1CFY0_9ZZZZ
MFVIGEKVEGYEVEVLNEREIRASAGILFLFGIISFMFAILTSNFAIAKIMVVAFMVDFIIRLLINPKYAPSLVIGRWIVNNQTPEYVGAVQKRWSWWVGLVLALIMFYSFVLNDIRGPINILICGSCLIFLFFEAVFGICLGCKLYDLFHKKSAQYCAGDVCNVDKKREDIQKTNITQWLSVIIFISFLYFLPSVINYYQSNLAPEKDCTVPQFAIDMGHEEVWKEHNNCL